MGGARKLRKLGAPAFRVKAGRTVVLALTNRGDIAEVFHLHGHHFRLLDRLDDGWKPFWLDTLAIEPGQTQRDRIVSRICRALADGNDGDGLGRAAPPAVLHCRVALGAPQ
jgi:FtsP/CotA-like multicopper oxidase with cupredoxin domain